MRREEPKAFSLSLARHFRTGFLHYELCKPYPFTISRQFLLLKFTNLDNLSSRLKDIAILVIMGPTSKDLLHLEQKSYISALEKSLFMLEKSPNNSQRKENTASSTSKGTLRTSAVPESQVLGKLKGFLEVIDEANRKLQTDVREKPCGDYDIEVLTGEEEHYIEMDLALGVTDLHTAEALAAAESALVGQREICVPTDSYDSDSGSGYGTEVSDGSDCETEGDDDSDSSCETEADRAGDKCGNNDGDAEKLVQSQNSGTKRTASIEKGQKRPKIEFLL